LKFVDTHCHLTSKPFVARIPEILEAAERNGVSHIVNVGCDLASSRLVCEQLAISPLLWGAVGIQPHDASTFNETDAAEIALLARNNKRVVAIGEIGLDGHYELSTMDKQIVCFHHFLEVAIAEDLPVIVHMRNTFQGVQNAIAARASRGLTGVIHCFTGNVEEAKAFLDLGFYISFSGIVTFKSPSEFDAVVRYVPADRILCETDAPYLAPKPHRGKTNEPAWVRHTCEHMAAVRGNDFELFASQTTQNARRLFKRITHV
jgi:TatD DNase family protein